MTPNTLITYEGGTVTKLDLRTRLGRPVGWAELDASGTLAGTLGELGAERIGRRLPLLFAEDDRDEVVGSLLALARRSRPGNSARRCAPQHEERRHPRLR
ncbi:hypothetical protein [Paractinoplanes toevensis]|uniref:Uncharacterized protein n=1 Tax=Paractinoplanes toevensis TaxID=571911 RepID=A0A919WDN2_9ACTN|nr:hypothetical protein [Actinoplanes toevensis]GIM98226.1 hypothetical protein Ato02nite_100190 [Actinoplanes toevensis]